MKQNKDGKIQNWHKPMHQGAFKNRFLRRRHVDPELQLPKETALPSGQLIPIRAEEVDACWNYRDPHGFGWEDENAFEGNYSHFLWMIFNAQVSLGSLSHAHSASPDGKRFGSGPLLAGP